MSVLAPSAGAAGAVLDATAPRGGKFLTFYLGAEEYGVEILKVQEIIGMQPITRVPRTPGHMCGVVNLRGKVIPIMDLRARFGMAAPVFATAAEAEQAQAVRCIIVAQVAAPQGGTMPVGLVVDRVSEVAAIGGGDIEPAPSFGAGVRTEYLLGLGKTPTADGQGRVRLLLDIDRVLAADELSDLAFPLDGAA